MELETTEQLSQVQTETQWRIQEKTVNSVINNYQDLIYTTILSPEKHFLGVEKRISPRQRPKQTLKVLPSVLDKLEAYNTYRPESPEEQDIIQPDVFLLKSQQIVIRAQLKKDQKVQRLKSPPQSPKMKLSAPLENTIARRAEKPKPKLMNLVVFDDIAFQLNREKLLMLLQDEVERFKSQILVCNREIVNCKSQIVANLQYMRDSLIEALKVERVVSLEAENNIQLLQQHKIFQDDKPISGSEAAGDNFQPEYQIEIILVAEFNLNQQEEQEIEQFKDEEETQLDSSRLNMSSIMAPKGSSENLFAAQQNFKLAQQQKEIENQQKQKREQKKLFEKTLKEEQERLKQQEELLRQQQLQQEKLKEEELERQKQLERQKLLEDASKLKNLSEEAKISLEMMRQTTDLDLSRMLLESAKLSLPAITSTFQLGFKTVSQTRMHPKFEEFRRQEEDLEQLSKTLVRDAPKHSQDMLDSMELSKTQVKILELSKKFKLRSLTRLFQKCVYLSLVVANNPVKTKIQKQKEVLSQMELSLGVKKILKQRGDFKLEVFVELYQIAAIIGTYVGK